MLKKPILISGIWSYANIIFTAISLTLIVLVFSRFLNVSQYGYFVSANLIIEFLVLFGGMGISAFIIKREKIDNKIISISFLIITLLSFLLIFIVNASYFINIDSKNISEIIFITRILSLNILTKSLLSIINSIWFRELNNKLITKISIISGISSLILVVFLIFVIDPFKALLIYTIGQPIIQLIISFKFINFKLFFVFDFLIIKEIFDYGVPIVFSRLISYANFQAPKIACGILLGNFELGLLSAAMLITESIHKIFISSMWSIWMPLLAKIKREIPNRFGEVYLRLRTIQAAIIMPILFLLIVMRRPILEYLLPEKFYQIENLLPGLLLAGVFIALNYLFKPTLVLIGKARQRIILDILRLILCFIFLSSFSKLGLIYITYSLVLIELILYFISLYFLKTILHKNIFQQINPLKGIIISLTIISSFFIISKFFLEFKLNLISLVLLCFLTLISYFLIVFKIDKNLFLEFRDLKNNLFKEKKFLAINPISNDY